MRNRYVRAVFIALACALALGACTVAPHGKTLLFTPDPKAAATASPAPGALGLKKAYPIDLGMLDQAGYFYDGTGLVCGWLDNDHIVALGTKTVSTEKEGSPLPAEEANLSDADRNLLRQKLGKVGRVSTVGITGQILSIDYQNLNKKDEGNGTKKEPIIDLHTAKDTVFTSLGLSPDKSMLWYISSGVDGTSKLSETDISFTHELLTVPGYIGGANPSWSSLGKYLYYIDYGKEGKTRPYVTLFDGVTSSVLPYTELSYMGMGMIGIDDMKGWAYSIIKNSAVISVPLSESDRKPATDNPIKNMRNFNNSKESNIYKAVWIGSEYVVMMSASPDGSSMGILNINSKDPPYWKDGILNFVFSDDYKYICLVKEGLGKGAEISVAEWQNGQMNNETPICPIANTTDAIYFSPDDTKLLISGWFELSSKTPSAKVIQIR